MPKETRFGSQAQLYNCIHACGWYFLPHAYRAYIRLVYTNLF